MVELGSFLNQHLEIATAASLDDDTLLVMPAGRVEIFGMDDVIMDASCAKMVIAQFEERGVDVPVDYEHSTKFKAANGEESPAAGWITSMWWEPTRGLVASVKWSDKARKQIQGKEYKYLSPHFDVDRKTRRVEFVLAVALTNTPRINNMEELVAASLAAASKPVSDLEEPDMKKDTRTRLCSALKLEDGTPDEEIIAQVEEAVAEEAPPGEPDPKQVATETLMMLRDAMVSAGVVGVEASLQEAVEAAIGLIGESGDEEAAASIAAAIGITSTKTTDIVAAITSRIASTVPADEVATLTEQVTTLTHERNERNATELVGSLVEAGKLNPHDEKKMTWARTQARENTEQFCSLMENAPSLYKSGQQTPEGDASGTKRSTVIASAVESYATDSCGASKKFYVNAALDEDGLEHLNDDEAKKHGIV